MKFYPHVTDQILHFAIAVAILSVSTLGWWGAMVAGAAIGLIRELTEAGGSRIALAEIAPHFTKRDPWIDLGFWALGGLAASLLLA